jgi:hypothetical protein
VSASLLDRAAGGAGGQDGPVTLTSSPAATATHTDRVRRALDAALPAGALVTGAASWL